MAFEGLTSISEAEAVEILRRDPVPDPTGQATPESLAANGQAFQLDAGGGGGVFVVKKNGAQLWIKAASGRSLDDLTAVGLALIEEMARAAGCKEVAFQTGRLGLVKKTAAHGFELCGWIMKKKVSDEHQPATT